MAEGSHRRSLGSHRHLQRDAAPREVCAGPVQGKLGERSTSSSSSWRSWNVGSRVHSSKAINVGSWRNPGCGIKLGINVGVLGFTGPAGAEIAPIPWPRASTCPEGQGHQVGITWLLHIPCMSAGVAEQDSCCCSLWIHGCMSTAVRG